MDSELFKLDGRPALGKAIPLALQHVVAMIVGCVTPAIIVSGSAGLSDADSVTLLQAALIVAALSTLLQLFPIFKGKALAIGSGLPVIMGISFAYVPSMQAIAASHLTARDVVLYFSYSGSTEELLKNLKIIRDRRAVAILVTRFPKSPGAAYADVVLQCGSLEGPLQRAALKHYVGIGRTGGFGEPGDQDGHRSPVPDDFQVFQQLLRGAGVGKIQYHVPGRQVGGGDGLHTGNIGKADAHNDRKTRANGQGFSFKNRK